MSDNDSDSSEWSSSSEDENEVSEISSTRDKQRDLYIHNRNAKAIHDLDQGEDESNDSSEESSDSESNQSEEKETRVDVMEQLRLTLRDMPLSKLAKLKKQGFRGQPLHKAVGLPGPEFLSDWINGTLDPSVLYRKKKQVQSQNQEELQGKKSRHVPQELSSKRKVSRFKEVISAPTYQARDPRFESISGTVDPNVFDGRYKFLDERRDQEIRSLKQALKSNRKLDAQNASTRRRKSHRKMNEEESEQARKTLTKLEQDKHNIEQSRKTRQFKSQIFRNERELVSKGKQPYFPKRSEMRKMQLEQKFEELNATGKLDNYMRKKRKKNAGRERKLMDAVS